ncbi:uncharacterized protein BO80DRAFT_21821 [Aspergillus ibericus CBS 121593]|uniref:Uncharacterized protein n=1 Tax=Aspergillus ibericus CBS 121593 TaxID=1448316 RepID=A0A395H5H0_9EURO|nr:hypothetical protein BO80DRAFT_21821 [Aspergillus ibericus CBS 121593]RAL02940.1 hypothetical protein BO80DRAFT_21821 [Aspergillus ibericus CBS 121593]
MSHPDKLSTLGHWGRSFHALWSLRQERLGRKSKCWSTRAPWLSRLAILTSLASHGGLTIHRMPAWNASRLLSGLARMSIEERNTKGKEKKEVDRYPSYCCGEETAPPYCFFYRPSV